MADLLRESAMGQLVRLITSNRVLLYPEERDDFEVPFQYALDAEKKQRLASAALSTASTEAIDTIDAEKKDVEDAESNSNIDIERAALERMETARSTSSSAGQSIQTIHSSQRHISRMGTRATLESIKTREDLEQAFAESALDKGPSRPIMPEVRPDGTILVDWYRTDDPENPQNWSRGKKFVASLQIYIYTLAVYMGSSIYTPSVEGVMHEFGVGATAASCGLALYVFGYGLGPLIFSPLSEMPRIGRNPPYILTMFIFVMVSIAAPLTPTFGGLLVCRLLQGFFGSPCLATGGASLEDIYSLASIPYVLCIWAFSATCGPALGPLISGFAVMAEGWRWSLWELLWFAGPVFLCMVLLLPETSSSNILLKRAQRLRKRTGDERLKSQSEIDQSGINIKEATFEALVRPIELIFRDPAVGFSAFYISICYAINYSFFEAFPLVYGGRYGMNIGEQGLLFLSITVGTIIAVAGYLSYIHWYVEPRMKTHGMGSPESRLIPAMFASFLGPIGLFLFGWTGNGDIYWIVSIIGVMLFTICIFVVIQCVFVYLPMTYPKYAASLFAGNDFARSMLAGAAVLFSRPMFDGMGIGRGVSLLGALMAACIGGVFVLYFFGAKLRARSTYAAK